MTRSRRRQNNRINRSNNVSYYKTRSSAKILKTANINKSSTINDDISLSPTNCESPELFINDTLNKTNQQQSDDDIVVLDTQPERDITIPDDNDSNLHVNFNLYCYSTCLFGRKHDREMIQCSTCMQWFHAECSDAVAESVIWNCNKCRNM